jgi:predicted component of type VI protein secretion system
MKKIFYEKVGRKYVPVQEYDEYLMDGLPYGNHLIMVYPGGQSTRYNVDPALAPMIAAGRVAEDRMCEALRKASEMRPARTPITPGQQRAWKKLAKEFGDDLATLNTASNRDIAEAGIRALQAEAEKLMTHEGVRAAYEHFLLVCHLCAKEDNE